VGPKRRPRAQHEVRPQFGLCQGGPSVGYKSACHVLETARDGSTRRLDPASCSPPLKQATSRSKPRQIEASGVILSALCTRSPFSDGSRVLRLVARMKAGYKWSDLAHFQQPLGSLAREGGSGSQVRDDQRRWNARRHLQLTPAQLTDSRLPNLKHHAWCTVSGSLISRLRWRSQNQDVLKHERRAGTCQMTRAHTPSAVMVRANTYVKQSLCLGCFSAARHGRTKTPPCRLRANRVPFNLTRRLLPAGGDPRTVTWQSDAVDRGHRKPDPPARPSRARADNKVGT